MTAVTLKMTKAKDKGHVCTVESSTSSSFLPPLRPSSGWFKRFVRSLKKSTLISEKHPKCGQYYRSTVEIHQIRKDQVDSKSIIIHPFSMFRVYYEAWMALVLIICQLYMPFDAAFDTHDKAFGEDQHFMYMFRFVDLVFSVICFVDIVLNFLTGYADDMTKTVELNPKKIAWDYIASKYFISDILSSLPDFSFLPISPNVVSIVNGFGMLKIIRLSTTYQYVTRTSDYFQLKNFLIYRTALISFFSFLIFHYVTCCLFLQPQIRMMFGYPLAEFSFVNTWRIAKKSVPTKYLTCFYHASGLMLGTQVGGKVSIPWDEVLFVVFLYIFGKLFTLFLTVVIVKILLEPRALEIKYHVVMSQVEGFMDRKRLSPTLQRRVVDNYKYKYNNSFFREDKITALLSEHIKREVKGEMLEKLISKVDIFQELSKPEMETVLTYLKCELYFPRDIIIKYGTLADCMYFISSGTVVVSSPSGKEICHLHDGAYFGEVCMLFKEKRRTTNVVALETCEVYKINKKGFNASLKNNKEVLQSMRDVALDRMELANIYEEIHLRRLMTKSMNDLSRSR